MAWSRERNRGRLERRQIHTRETSPEHVCFPYAAQAAQLFRHIGTHKPETVWLLTSRPPDRLDATGLLGANRHYWGVEGLHQRLDASTNEDACRVRNRNAIWILGMFRRLAASLFAEWRARDPARHRTTMTDFHSWMDAEHTRQGIRLLTSRHPSLSPRS